MDNEKFQELAEKTREGLKKNPIAALWILLALAILLAFIVLLVKFAGYVIALPPVQEKKAEPVASKYEKISPEERAYRERILYCLTKSREIVDAESQELGIAASEPYATTFYRFWYEAGGARGSCEIVRNRNPEKDFHRIFVRCKNPEGDWHCIEPSSGGTKTVLMRDYWGEKYDESLNIYGETEKWIPEFKATPVIDASAPNISMAASVALIFVLVLLLSGTIVAIVWLNKITKKPEDNRPENW